MNYAYLLTLPFASDISVAFCMYNVHVHIAKVHSEFRKSILVVPKCQQKWLFQRTTTTTATEHGMNELKKKLFKTTRAANKRQSTAHSEIFSLKTNQTKVERIAHIININ